jgi:extracellular elastinolytic metalloproteinase
VTPNFPPTATYTPLPTRTSTATRTNTLTPTLTLTPTNSITPPSGAIFWDDFDPVKESWTHSAVKGVDDWVFSTTRAHSPTHSYFCSEPATPKDDFLVMRPVSLPANAQLTFWHTYQMESRADAAVLEISIDGGITYMDLGPRILSGGYNNSITSNTSPIFGRQAWTGGTIGTWSQVIVDLGNYAGQSANIRFRSTTDNGKAGKGWFIDDIRISG